LFIFLCCSFISDTPNEIQVNLTEFDVIDVDFFNITAGIAVNCSANGNPKPDVTWTPIRSAFGSNPLANSNGTGWALLALTAVGIEKWECSATNTPDDPFNASVIFSFKGLVINELNGFAGLVIPVYTLSHRSVVPILPPAGTILSASTL